MQSLAKFLIIASLCFVSNVQAQIFDQTERKFKEGISFYNLGRYDLAMQQFAEITSRYSTTELAPLAHYYYGLAAFKLKKYNESNLMLLQLLSRYPRWEERDEAYYLLGINYLELEDYSKGLDYLNRISDPGMGKDIQGVKQNYIQNLKSIQTLKALNKVYPNDRIIAHALVMQIQAKSSDKAELELSDQLTNQFGIEVFEEKKIEQTTSLPTYEKKWTKGYFNVAVLFPYRLSEFRSSKRNISNQYAFDYFTGLQIARQTLQSEGILVNLQAYDVSNEETTVLNMMNNNFFRQTDLIFGPLYAKPYDLVASFADLNNILMVNPLATDGNLLENGKWVYLAHPSINTQMREVVELAKTKSKVPIAAIYYGSSPKDSSMAFTYRDELIKDGGKVLEMKMLTGGSESMNIRVSLFEIEKPNHIVFFSNEPRAGQAFMSVLSGRKLSNLPVMASANSFDFNRSRPTGFGRNLYLIATDYVDVDKDSIKEFQVKYYNKTNTLPSVYSYLGYDQMLFFGRMLGKYKEQLKDGIELRKYNDDYLLTGFNYTKSRENKVSSILKFEDSRWVPME